MEKHLLSDTFELTGRWWLPGHEDKAVAGTLYCSPEDIKLKLHGILRTKPVESPVDVLRSVFEPDDDDNIETVFGETEDGLCSLLNAFTSSTNTSWSGIYGSTYSANLVIQGSHITSLDVPCREVSFGSTLHERFFKLPIFDTERNSKGETWSMTVKYAWRERHYETEANEQLRLTASISNPHSHHSIEIHHKPFFKLSVSTPQPLKRQFDRMTKVCDLFTLLTDEVVAPTYCDARIESENDSIRVFYRARDRMRGKTAHAVLPLLNLEKVENTLEAALQRWLSANGQVIGSAILLFLEGRENNYPSIEGQFLVLTQALEAISRATMTCEYMTESEYEKVLQVVYKAIPSTLSEGHKRSLKKKIKHGHEHSLRKRIDSLLGSLEEETQRLVCRSADSFVSGVVETRNYLNHYTDELREKAFTEGEHMYWANVRMTMLLRILLLKYLGFDEGAIRSAIREHSHLGQLANRARHFPECVVNT